MPYAKEQIRELKDAVTPLESVEWLLDHGYPIEVKGLGKKYIDIKCPNPEHTDHTLGSCKISTGKYFREGEKLMLPISDTCHHGLMDGYHVAKFIETLDL